MLTGLLTFFLVKIGYNFIFFERLTIVANHGFAIEELPTFLIVLLFKNYLISVLFKFRESLVLAVFNS